MSAKLLSLVLALVVLSLANIFALPASISRYTSVQRVMVASGKKEINGWFVLTKIRSYDERIPAEPSYPSASPSIADFDASKIEAQSAPQEITNESKSHRPTYNELTHAPPG